MKNIIYLHEVKQWEANTTRKDIQTALEYAAESVNGEEVHFAPITLREEL